MLARAGVGVLRIMDDDTVEASNLHRQILYAEADVGKDKLTSGIEALRRACPDTATRFEPVRSRLLPDNARAAVRDVDIVVEGSDNFATKFLCADACYIEQKPCIQGAAVRWVATALCSGPRGKPCYRCLFEDMPETDQASNCAEAGVLGAVVGMGAALMTDLALRMIEGKPDCGHAYSYDGKRDTLRRHRVYCREACSLCGERPAILDIGWSTYVGRSCAPNQA